MAAVRTPCNPKGFKKTASHILIDLRRDQEQASRKMMIRDYSQTMHKKKRHSEKVMSSLSSSSMIMSRKSLEGENVEATDLGTSTCCFSI